MWVVDRIKECVPFGVRSHIVAMEGDGWFDPILKIVLILNCNVRAFRYKRILFFMNCRDAGRFVRCGFVYIIVCYGAAHPCFRGLSQPTCMDRAFRARIVYMLPRAMFRARGQMVSSSLRGPGHSYVAAHPWCRVHVYMLPRISAAARLCGRASVVPRILIQPRTCAAATSSCCRAFVLPRTHGSAHLYAAAHPCYRALPHVAAQLYMLPRSSTCGRALVLCCRAVLHIAAHCRMCPRSV